MLQSFQRRIYPHNLFLSRYVLRFVHGLHLQAVHAREAAYALLVEREGFAVIFCCFGQGRDFAAQGEEFFAGLSLGHKPSLRLTD